ncbi:MAG TPA: ferritin family protein [Desulfatiglandales bacterium]|nr:ferritin family protein [Desulfatiglandales bacterium]
MAIYGFNADEMFQVAIDTEKNGKLFYEKAMLAVDDPGLKSLLESLARDELEHIKTFTELKAQLPKAAAKDTVWDPFHEMDEYLQTMADMSVFRSGLNVERELSGIKKAEDVIRLGIQFEKDSIIFYTTMQDAVEEKKGRKFIGQLVDEEKKHLRKLCQKLGKDTKCER